MKLLIPLIGIIFLSCIWGTIGLSQVYADPTFRIAVTGDISCSSNGQNTVNQIINQNPSLVLWLGDLSYVDSDVDCFISETSQLASKDEAIVGNHDDSEDGTSSARAQLINYFGIPSTGYYSKTFDVSGTQRTDDVLLIGMDTQSPITTSSSQYQFVENSLKNSNSPLKIVMVHKPFLSCTCQHSSNGQFNAYHALFKQYGVDLVLQGHNHNIQYFNSIDNIKYIVSGAGGKSHYALTTSPQPAHFRDDSTYGFTLIDANFATKQLQGRFITNGGVDKSTSHFSQYFVQNSAPIAEEQSVTVSKNTVESITLAASDPDNDPLTYSILTQPLHGTISSDTGASLTYTASANYVGPDSFTFKVSDGSLDSNSATVNINVQNEQPVADDKEITVSKNAQRSFSLTAADPNHDPLTYTIVTPPSHGALSPSGTGPSRTYTPAMGYQGADSFTFKVSDGSLDSEIATVSINVQNDRPIADDQQMTVTKNTQQPLTLAASDPNHDPLTYTIVTAPSHGTLSPSGATVASRTYTPENNYLGTDIFTFKANDGTADSNIASVNVNIEQPKAVYNYAPSFAATGANYKDSPDSASLRLTQFSVAVWFKTSTDFATDSIMVNKGGLGTDNTGENMNYGIWMTSAEKVKAGFETSAGADQYITSVNSYSDGHWHYAVVTNDGSTLRLYVDGVQVATKALAGALPENTGTKPVRIGANSRITPPGNFFTGEVDEVRIWNDDLTTEQVSNAFAGTEFSVSKQVLYMAFGGFDYAPVLVLSGANYKDSPDSASLRLTQFSVAVWFKTSTDFATDSIMVNKGGLGTDSAGQNMNYGIWMTSAEKVKAGFETSAGADQYITSVNSYSDGHWHYAVVTNDGSTLRLYVDGVQVATKALAGALPENTGTKPVRIGANSRITPPGNFFTGEVDEVRIWNDDLTTEQVSNAFAGTDFSVSKQVLYLSFNSAQ